METYPTTREIMVAGVIIPKGTMVKASLSFNGDKVVILVEGVGTKFFQVSPVKF